MIVNNILYIIWKTSTTEHRIVSNCGPQSESLPHIPRLPCTYVCGELASTIGYLCGSNKLEFPLCAPRYLGYVLNSRCVRVDTWPSATAVS